MVNTLDSAFFPKHVPVQNIVEVVAPGMEGLRWRNVSNDVHLVVSNN